MTAAVRTSTVRPPAAPVRAAMAALVDVRACSAPRLRAIAEECGGRPVGVIGTFHEAKRAASMGVVVGAFMAPPLGSMAPDAFNEFIRTFSYIRMFRDTGAHSLLMPFFASGAR